MESKLILIFFKLDRYDDQGWVGLLSSGSGQQRVHLSEGFQKTHQEIIWSGTQWFDDEGILILVKSY